MVFFRCILPGLLWASALPKPPNTRGEIVSYRVVCKIVVDTRSLPAYTDARLLSTFNFHSRCQRPGARL
jgi:hypothetical protein